MNTNKSFDNSSDLFGVWQMVNRTFLNESRNSNVSGDLGIPGGAPCVPLPFFTQLSCFYITPVLVVLGFVFNALCFYVFHHIPKTIGDFYQQKIIIIVDVMNLLVWIQFIIYYRIVRIISTPITNAFLAAFGVYSSIFFRDMVYNLVLFMLIMSNYERALSMKQPVYYTGLNHKARNVKAFMIGLVLACAVSGYNLLGSYMVYDAEAQAYRSMPVFMNPDYNARTNARKIWIMVSNGIHFTAFASLIAIVAFETWLFRNFLATKKALRGQDTQANIRKNKSEITMTSLLLGHTVLVLVCSLPSNAYNILSLFNADGRSPMMRILISVAMLCSLFASSTNLPLYYVIGPQFRNQVNKVIFRTANQVGTVVSVFGLPNKTPTKREAVVAERSAGPAFNQSHPMADAVVNAGAANQMYDDLGMQIEQIL